MFYDDRPPLFRTLFLSLSHPLDNVSFTLPGSNLLLELFFFLLGD